MRYALISFLSGLVLLLSPTLGAVPASPPLLPQNNDGRLDDLSNPIPLLDEDDEVGLNQLTLEDGGSNTATSDLGLPKPSPQFDRAHLPAIYHLQSLDHPTRSSLSPRALVSLVANANSSTFVDAQGLAVTAAGGGKSTGKSKTSADPLGYSYLGCYTDPGGGVGSRTLIGKRTDDNAMTKEFCQAFCGVWPYYGMEFARECYCGNAILNGGVKVDDSFCNDPCAGNSSETCGGGGHMSIYYDPSVPGPNDPPVFNNANLLGCYIETFPIRVLDNGGIGSDTSMDLTMCFDYCNTLTTPEPRKYWGVESGKDCWCGIDINSTATLAPSLDYCGMACTGNELQLCGSSDLIAVYRYQVV